MARRWVRRLAIAGGMCLAASAALAQDATWNGTTADWNTATNWSPPTAVPAGTATFAAAGSFFVSTSASVTIGAIDFAATPNAQAYTFTIGNSFTINGAGITNSSTNPQSVGISGDLVFQNASTGNNGTGQVDYEVNLGTVTFNNTSNAGNAATTWTDGGGFSKVTFNDSATAGSANITVNTSATLTFDDASSAASAIITNNTGTVAFDNTSTAGSASITNSRTLQFNNAATAGGATITNAGTTDFNDGSNAGSAHITNQLTGVIVFNATSSASTATISNTGNLDFEGTATAGSATITTTGPGGFTAFAAASSGDSARLITNPGGIVDISNLTTGGTTAGSIEGGGDYFLGGKQLTVGSNNLSTTVSGLIADGGTGGGIGGSLDKVGAGTLTLADTNTYTGATAIDGGTLTVTGSIASSSGVAIDAGGTLNGTGSVSAVTVNSGGILMPGLPGAVGTLTGTGNVLFNAGASYQILISGTANSKYTTAGGATLSTSASVGILSGSSIVVGNKYTILTANGGVAGTFDPTVHFGNFNGTLSYDADDVFLTFEFASLAPLLPANAPQNAANVATTIDNFLASGGTLPAGFQALFNLPAGQLVNGLEQLDGETATGAQIAGFQLMNQFMSLMLDPFTEGHNNGIGPVPFAPVGQPTTFTPDVASAYASVLKAPLAPPASSYGPWHAWGAAYGGNQSISGAPATVGSHDITARAGGFAGGLDYRASADTMLGFALAGGATGWDLAQGFGSGHSDAFQAGLYGTHQIGQAYVSGALAFTNFWASTKRIVAVSGVDTLQASFDAQSFGARVEGGYRANLAPVTLTPYAALQAQSFHTPTFGETAASGSPQFALNFASQTSTAERAEVGSWASHTFLLANGDSLTLFGRAAYAHDWFTNLALTPTFQALPGASFVVNGVTPPPDLGLVTAGAEWHMAHNWSLMARFDGEFGNGDQTYTGTARLRYAW
jgi:uncharacterized protein with beta-barrel porin domain